MKDLFKELLKEKTMAMLVLFGIAIGAYCTMPSSAEKIVIPIVTGICSFITGYAIGQAVTSDTTQTKIKKENE